MQIEWKITLFIMCDFQVTKNFSKVADFVTVYIAEAHPTDGWAIPGNVEVANHKWVFVWMLLWDCPVILWV